MRTSLLVLFACIGYIFAGSLDGISDFEFKAWALNNNKTYSNSEEASYRYSVWSQNKAFIVQHNSEVHSYTVRMNSFGDLTIEEFRSMYNGLKTNSKPRNEVTLRVPAALPPTVDWRTKGVVTPVKNQGQCGSCWSFSTTGSVEGQHALATGKLVGLSESNLVDCSSGFGNQGCNGGLMDDAFNYIQQCGLDTESSYPYTPTTGSCSYKTTTIGAKITGHKDVTSGSETQLQTAVATIGPISVAIDASHSSFQFYSGGVYNEPACSTTQLDHGVLAVGYGTSAGKPYWLVKNSWGPSWGLQGYIMMSRNAGNQCGISTMASYPTGASARVAPADTAATCTQSSSSSSASSATSSSSTGMAVEETENTLF